MAIVATQNFYIIDRLLENQVNPDFRNAVETLGAADARDLLRYLSSEINRLYFQYWSVAQLAIGILTLWLVTKLPARPFAKARWSIIAMLGIVLFLTVAITPQVVTVGRALDFIPRDPPPPSLRTFGLLHAAYTVLDLVKLILGIMVTVWLVRDNGPSLADRSKTYSGR
jgi:hypothetical protein